MEPLPNLADYKVFIQNVFVKDIQKLAANGINVLKLNIE